MIPQLFESTETIPITNKKTGTYTSDLQLKTIKPKKTDPTLNEQERYHRELTLLNLHFNGKNY
jgi:hypothetical protein